MRKTGLALTLLFALTTPALAVQPDEVLSDPGLEARARALSQKLRCPICQGENIDESNAAISRDLRLYVRERLVEGDSDAEVLDNVADRFGEFVLFEPRASGGNLLLWLAGPLMALIALLVAWGFLRARARAEVPATQALSKDERARLDEIMRD
ncbi:cytochrome c-type biogenesis protein CcmH [Paracoccus alcaliphilus]|uniref:Cytochrome c-type biogenesis protein n=1 Tax=Paracoccus alcaliphilus TaxID=34002 RepID=A0A1H8KP20_9RHOB|nr:cytochrome c-type biogenesis protein [Paracoccus alcaliphilus]WCR19974.1 cytochrome c-type biogenesis protein CcmH [Paracoccus alcaliphilus]SEN94659.1 cytochrome c-type biogenesis protein CcmH [Paracoccus alcaliphilus]